MIETRQKCSLPGTNQCGIWLAPLVKDDHGKVERQGSHSRDNDDHAKAKRQVITPLPLSHSLDETMAYLSPPPSLLLTPSAFQPATPAAHSNHIPALSWHCETSRGIQPARRSASARRRQVLRPRPHSPDITPSPHLDPSTARNLH